MRHALRAFAVWVVFAAIPGFAQSGWEKVGTASGNVTAIVRGAGNTYVALQGAGVWSTNDMLNFSDQSAGLPSYDVLDLAKGGNSGTEMILLAALKEGVYLKKPFQSFIPFSEGLPSVPITSVALYRWGNMAAADVYCFALTADGQIYERLCQWRNTNLDCSAFGTWQGIEGPNGGTTPVLDIAAGGNGTTATLLAGAKNTSGMDDGRIYSWDIYSANPFWNMVEGPSGPLPADDYTSVFLEEDGSTAMAASRGNGVWVGASDSLSPVCAAGGPAGEAFISVHSAFISTERQFLAGGEKAFYYLTPQAGDCTDPAQAYHVVEPGATEALLVDSYLALPFRLNTLHGAAGKGLRYCSAVNLTPSCQNRGGFSSSQPMETRNIAQIVPVTDQVLFAASRTDGLYKTVDGDYFVRVFYAPDRQGAVGAVSVAVHPSYDEAGIADSDADGIPDIGGVKAVFVATVSDGVYRSYDGGMSWEKCSVPVLNGSAAPRLSRIALSPNFASDHLVILAEESCRIWTSGNGGMTWDLYDDLCAAGEASRINDLALSRNFQLLSYAFIFAATDQGVFRYQYDPGGPVRDHVFNICAGGTMGTSVDVSPRFGQIYFNNEEEKTVVAGIQPCGGGATSGLYASMNFGDAGTWALIPGTDLGVASGVLKLHPNPFSPLRVFSSMDDFSSGAWGGLTFQDYTETPPWTPANLVESGLPADGRIHALGFYPAYDGSSESRILLGHDRAGLFWNADPGPYGSSWTAFKGFYNTPKVINDIAVRPDDPSTVVAATQGYGVMISLDGGASFLPAGSLLNSSGQVVPDALSVAITQAGGAPAQIVGGTSADGIYHRMYQEPASLYVNRWAKSTLDGGAFGTDPVTKITYKSLSEDMWAAYMGTTGPIHSADQGTDWLADTSAPSLSSFDYERFSGFGRGLTNFTWGAQSGVSRSSSKRSISCTGSGKSLLKRANGAIACAWSELNTNGLDPCCDYRAIKQDSDGTLYLGCYESTTPGWVRVYRGENCPRSSQWSGLCADPVGSCQWSASDRGLADTTGRVTSFALTSNGILVGLDSGPALRSGTTATGGVYFSDTHSNGHAWVRVDSLPSSCSSSTALAGGGTTVFTSTDCDGAYASAAINYTGPPSAYYAWERDPWNETRIIFRDYSAGFTDSYSWYFDAGWNPGGDTYAFDYGASGPATLPRLNACSPYGCNSYPDGALPSVTLYYTYPLTISRDGGNLKAAWARLGSDEGLAYNLYASADGLGANPVLLKSISAGDGTYCDAATCWFSFHETGVQAFYTVQARP